MALSLFSDNIERSSRPDAAGGGVSSRPCWSGAVNPRLHRHWLIMTYANVQSTPRARATKTCDLIFSTKTPVFLRGFFLHFLYQRKQLFNGLMTS